MKKTRLFLMNAVIMTATSLLLSSVGVWFNLYLLGKLGAESMGVFQLISSVYTMVLTLAASGIGLAATRLVAEESEPGGAGGRAAMRRCLLYSLFFGTLAAAALFFGAPVIGKHWLGAVQTIRPLKIMSLSMPFVAMSCAFSGYFTAVRRVANTAAAQLLEQFLKISLTMAGLLLISPPGLESACIAIVAAGAIAETCSFLFELVLYLFDRRHCGAGTAAARHGLTERLLGIALPVAFSSYLRSGLSTVKHLLIPIRLQTGGLSASAAFSVFGLIHGVALPVVLFPYAFLSAFNSLIVPELARYHSQSRNSNGLIRKIFELTLCFSFGVCGWLFCFAPEIGAAVSENRDVGIYIRLLAPIVPIMYLDTAVDNILKGINEQLSVMRTNVADAAFSLAGVWLLLPVLGIKGYILVICSSEIFNFAISLNRLIKVTNVRLDFAARVVRPLLCSATAALLTGMLLHTARGLPAQMLAAALAVVCAALYLLLLWLSGWNVGELHTKE